MFCYSPLHVTWTIDKISYLVYLYKHRVCRRLGENIFSQSVFLCVDPCFVNPNAKIWILKVIFSSGENLVKTTVYCQKFLIKNASFLLTFDNKNPVCQKGSSVHTAECSDELVSNESYLRITGGKFWTASLTL